MSDATSYSAHQKQSRPIVPRFAVVTLSDTRNRDTDQSGRRIQELIEADDGRVVRYELIRDDAEPFRLLLDGWLANPEIDCIISTGGTGIARRDQAIDIVSAMIGMLLPGFGELFRMLSFEQIQSGAMLSRAVGGVANGKLLFALPGSTAAVELAMQRLILPEIRHLLDQLTR